MAGTRRQLTEPGAEGSALRPSCCDTRRRSGERRPSQAGCSGRDRYSVSQMYQQGGYQQQPGAFGGPPGFGSGAPSFGGGAPSFGGHQQNPYHGGNQPKAQDDRFAGKGKQDPVLAVTRCAVAAWCPGAATQGMIRDGWVPGARAHAPAPQIAPLRTLPSPAVRSSRLPASGAAMSRRRAGPGRPHCRRPPAADAFACLPAPPTCTRVLLAPQVDQGAQPEGAHVPGRRGRCRGAWKADDAHSLPA